MSVTLSPPLAEQSPEEDRRWTVEEFSRAADAGSFIDPSRLEIIHGRIMEKMPEGGRHTGLRRRIARRLRAVLEPGSFVCEDCPLRIAFDGEPIPDVMFTKEEDYGDQYPTPKDVMLLIEVAGSSVAYDLGEKALLYAQAGVGDYWVVLVKEAAIVRHREPTSEGYQSVTRLAGADALSPMAMLEAVWTVDALLGYEGAPEES